MMELKLNDDEVREALKKALEVKVSHILGELDPDNCWFEIRSSAGEVEDIETVEFCSRVISQPQ